MSVSFGVQKIESLNFGWSYFGFNRFRHRIARSCGLKDVYPGTEADMYKTGRYIELSDNLVYPLLEHSDCDGKMDPEDCGKVGVYLKLILQEWKGEDAEEKEDIARGELLVDAMLGCYEGGNSLIFI